MRTALLLMFLAPVAFAGDFNKVLSVGDAAPTWKDLEGIDGKQHTFDEFKAKDCLVVVFTCNTCVTSNDYEERIIKFVNKHCGKDGKTALVAINANQVKEDLLPKMKERAEKKKYNFAYLTDPTQATAKAYGAKWTPEFFVLNKDRKVVYMGAMDDKTKAAEAKENYVELAVAAALNGKAAEKGESPARGCLIRYLQKRD
ncbi:thioredoxin family protein [soil metagenome]